MKLQIALDLIDLPEALALVAKVADIVDVIEVGTPLVIKEGIKAVTEIKRTFPALEVLADLKIMDAGDHEAKIALEAGADIVTGLAVRGFAMRLMHLGFKVYVVGDTTTPSITDEDLLLIGSGSGSTGSLVVSAKKARSIGAKIGLVTIQGDSEIGKLADIVLTIPAPSPKLAGSQVSESQQPLGSLFEQGLFLTLDAIIRLLMVKTEIEGDAMFALHANLE